MNKNICIALILGIALLASCKKDSNEIDFNPDVEMRFEGVGDSNIVHIEKGIMDYTAKINVASPGHIIRLFQIYWADTKTGNRGDLIESSVKAFTNPESSYSTNFTISGLTENRCIKIVVTDTLEQVYEKNLLVKITPSVHFSETVSMETVENYYGPYYASWLTGRVYMRNTAYTANIDFSLGDIVISSEGTEPVPALVNPALRKDYELLTAPGLQSTKFALTSLTPADYNAISQVDDTPIISLSDPQDDAVRIEKDKIYLFKTADGKKGLIHITSLSSKKGTIENAGGEWVEDTQYYEVKLNTKTIMP